MNEKEAYERLSSRLGLDRESIGYIVELSWNRPS
jgi:hypothetical protein